MAQAIHSGPSSFTPISNDATYLPYTMRTFGQPGLSSLTPFATTTASLGHVRTTILDCIEKQWIDGLKMPQNFIVYAFSLSLQLSHGHIIHIRDLVQQWVQWDLLESLAKYHSVVKTVFGIVKSALIRESLWVSHAIAEETFQRLSQDVHDLHDQLVAIFSHSESYKFFLTCRGDLAQHLLDLLQDLLDSFPESPARPRLFKALVRLSHKSELHPTCFPLRDLQIVGHQVAGGAFGDIWRGLVHGQSVSVKIMRLFGDEVKAAIQKFGREALIWRQLSHPNLLPFFGLYYLEKRLCLVSPWMSNGHVLQFLKNAPPNTDRVSLILDVAMGLAYLHHEHVVHGDLKGMNILVTPSRRACLADFGLSSIVDEVSLRFTHSTASGRGGTVRYQAPELLKEQMQIHYGSDIWTGKAPFFDVSLDATVIFKVLDGGRPSRPPTIPFDDPLWLLLQDCWQERPCDRPNVSQIIEHLVGPTIGAKTTDAAIDWDETISSKCRRSLQEWLLLPSITTIERRIFGDDVVEGEQCYFLGYGIAINMHAACLECFPERPQPVSYEKQGHKHGSTSALPLRLLSNDHMSPTRWHPSGILSPIAEHNFTLEQVSPFRSSLQTRWIPFSWLTANHYGPPCSDGRPSQLCPVYVPTHYLEVHRAAQQNLPSPRLIPPHHDRSASRRPPTPNNFSSLLENYIKMRAEPPSDASPRSSSDGWVPDFRAFLASPSVATRSEENHSVVNTPDLDPYFTSPPESVSDNFGTPNDSPFSDFQSPLFFSAASEEILGPSLRHVGHDNELSLFGGI
ncbi:Protein kinase domain-containing protein [Mycena venus]|uniref:Protein kinase domain-containing protein n=1 Tax=Mycena venus TaxID=2733690 RepID=A0A8H7D639_9AGAR|nr:Protein kinase domain-containing protein [Mycena venus]